MRISDWSSDVCSSDLVFGRGAGVMPEPREREIGTQRVEQCERLRGVALRPQAVGHFVADMRQFGRGEMPCQLDGRHFVAAHLVAGIDPRSEERRVGNECVSTCKSWGSAYTEKNNKKE